MADAPERIYAWPSLIAEWLCGGWSQTRFQDDAVAYILATPEALAECPEVAKLIADAEARGSKAMSESDFDCLVLDGIAEALKAMRKFPQPNYVISKIAEEAGEVVKAAIHCAEGRETVDNLRGEMKQLIAMIYRLWVEGDQVHGLPPVSAAIRSEATK